MIRIAIISQARTGSTRLPEKVLMDLHGCSLLDRHLERLRGNRCGAEVAVATTTLAADEAIVALCSATGCRCLRGPVDDVLERYLIAARQLACEVVVRVTSDCPLIDPAEIDTAVAAVLAGADYASNSLERRIPRGIDVEAMTVAALERAGREAHTQAEREHVTPYIRNHPELFRIVSTGPTDDCSRHRWTVDTPQDLAVVRHMLGAVLERWPAVSWRELMAVADAHPEWASINASIEQKHSGAEAAAATWTGYPYRCLPRQEVHDGDRRLSTIQPDDFQAIRVWRNAQLTILRQRQPLSEEDQASYVLRVIMPSYSLERPAQILFAYRLRGALIGYGGLVHIDWEARRAEVSFLLEPARSADPAMHAADLRAFIALLRRIAFGDIGLNRLWTETWDVRPHHVAALEAAGLRPEGRMRQHAMSNGRLVDALLHGMLATDPT